VLVLALDTTTRAGSVAVVRDGEALAELVGDATVTHGARLPGDLDRALAGAGVSIDAIDLLAVASGPGSFTGLRVGIAAMQGLAMALGLRIVPVSALDALATAATNRHDRRSIAAWMDAQRGQVFAALYDAAGRVRIEATALSPAETIERWRSVAGSEDVRFIGDGAVRYASVLRERLGEDVEIAAPPPLAAVIARIAAGDPGRAVLPHAVVPLYIRRPDAELARAKADR
jgi:tRNA threonylcarbamoyladenosine biosynthesis protein TsaB